MEQLEPEKDESIRDVLARLRGRLGADAFDVVDHWEVDLCAIGIAKPTDHATLVYISTYGETRGQYHVELEGPPSGDDVPYTTVGRFESLSFEQLVEIVVGHLGVRNEAPEPDRGTTSNWS